MTRSRQFESLLRWLRSTGTYRRVLRSTRRPGVGEIDFGDLRRVSPISRTWGFDRGLPVDRYYIERFLAQHASDIRGRTLEVGDNKYTRRFGADQVTASDVIDVAKENPKATVVADLADAFEVPSNSFDSVICTQTLQLVPDLQGAVSTLYRILKPGGVVLATIPVISPLASEEKLAGQDLWRLTSMGASWLFGSHFDPNEVSVQGFGNCLTATVFLYGIAAAELEPEELDHFDPRFQMLTAVRARKPRGPS